MIRGFVDIVGSDSPLPHLSQIIDSYKKGAVRLTENNCEFFVSVEGTDYSFKVVGNVRQVSVDSGVVRIGFVFPSLDVVVSCSRSESDVFASVVQNLAALPVHKPQASGLRSALCSLCCSYAQHSRLPNDDPDNGIKERSLDLFSEQNGGLCRVAVDRYPYLTKITAYRNKLVEIPEAIGSLPCLQVLVLSHNRLGEATNWNWLVSPFIRENLRVLLMATNGFFSIPETLGGLRNLETLNLYGNYLRELPATMANLKNLRHLDVAVNKLAALPSWMYRGRRFDELYTYNNLFHVSESALDSDEPRLHAQDFENVPLPTLLQTAASLTITNRLAFWEYNIPATLAEYLQGAYYCRCTSVVLPDTIGRVLRCRLKAAALAEGHGDDNDDEDDEDDDYYERSVFITVRCCSYDCYKLIEPHIKL